MKFINVDGNTATAKIAYLMSEVANIYPITPSSSMAELCDEWAGKNELNIFDRPVLVKQLQSEAGVSGAVHGSLACGALTTTFTSSQGLLLMIPNMYKIAGELLPTVFHISARALATHALSIFGDHSDVMAVRSTGFNILASNSVQECLDMALVAHLSAIDSSLPFIHFFDGFRTSHEIQKIQDIDREDIKKLINYDKIEEFRNRALTPNNPHQQGTAQNPDIYFQNREASNKDYENVYDIVKQNMEKVYSITGRKYEPYEYYGDENAENIVVLMGSAFETVKETIDYLNKNGKKYGAINVRLYRPFNSKSFANKIPMSVKNIAVLDRTKETNSIGEPLYLDVLSALSVENRQIKVIGGRYGLGGKEFAPNSVKAIFDNLENQKKNNFTVGIVDDVTHLSLELDENFTIDNNTTEFKFYGLGSDGTVSANKNTIKIIGEHTNLYSQGYFEYDSKKSGSLTISHLRISENPIRSTYTCTHPSFVAIHNFSFMTRYKMLKGIKENAIVLINTTLTEKELNKNLPKDFKETLINKNCSLYTINAQKIAESLGLGNKINVIMQSAFFKLSNIIPFEVAKNSMIEAIKATYGKKGEKVVNANIEAVNSISELKKIDLKKLDTKEYLEKKTTDSEYYENYIRKIDELEGNDLKVSSFSKDGYVPTDTTKYQKRGTAEKCPKWISENCIECGICAMSCPHACLKAVALNGEQEKNKPAGFETKNMLGKENTTYRMQLSPLDCTGCGVCASVCPAKNKALEMVSAKEILEQESKNHEFAETIDNSISFPINTTKSLQFDDSYFKYNFACAGCGETPYINLVTKLFGKNMIIANATGCSSIYGGSAPACPYAKDKNGKGPAWANSLFEDNAEFGLGMRYAINNQRENIKSKLDILYKNTKSELINKWLENTVSNKEVDEIIKEIENLPKTNERDFVLKNKDYLYHKSVWVIGGDGWAYDIGYAGLDHLLNSNENINVLVLDSEVYSNTGGQSSKSTPKGASAKFASNGKQLIKKIWQVLL